MGLENSKLETAKIREHKLAALLAGGFRRPGRDRAGRIAAAMVFLAAFVADRQQN
jgi:hypothetical protein